MSNIRMEISNKVKGLIRYYDLGYVLNHIESLITLPPPIKNKKMTSKQFDINRQISFQTEFESKIEFDNFSNEYDLRKNIFENIRAEYPVFCQSMKNSVSDEEYQEYLSLLKECNKKINKLMISFTDRTNDNYYELLLEKKDLISNIIDTEDMSRLTYLQDNFVLTELSTIDSSKFEPQTQENIDKLKNILNERISSYKFFRKLYSSKNIIRLNCIKNATDKQR